MKKEKIVVLTGAGMSAESGISTFRDSDGLWQGVDVMSLASIEGWHRNPEKVLGFYNARRRQLAQVQPNAGHRALVDLEKEFDVVIITQNVDDLHERAGSGNVMHLHGELTKARAVDDEASVRDIGYSDIHPGDCDERGRQLRPHIVWFGETVPMIAAAAQEVSQSDIVIVIGTSLVVYPAAALVDVVPPGKPVYVIDRKRPDFRFRAGITFIQQTAAAGVPELAEKLLQSRKN